MTGKEYDEIHQEVKSNGGITLRKNCFNEINKNYPEDEATRIGLNTIHSNIHYTKKFEDRLEKEKAKNNIITKPKIDFWDLGIGR